MSGTEPTGAERRTHVRWRSRMSASLTGDRVKDQSCSVRDISWGGVFVEYEREEFEVVPDPARGWTVGDAVDIGVTLPKKQGKFRVRGRVARADTGVFYHGLGIAISEATSTFRVLMQQLSVRAAPARDA